MPRNRGFWVSLMVCPSMVRVGDYLYSAVLGVKRHDSHLPMFRANPLSLLRLTTLSTSVCILLSVSSFGFPLTASVRAMAYALTRVSGAKPYSRSSRKVMKRSGDSTAPCSTPSLMTRSLLLESSTLTLAIMLLSNDLTHDTKVSGTSFFSIFSSRADLLTVSKALL